MLIMVMMITIQKVCFFFPAGRRVGKTESPEMTDAQRRAPKDVVCSFSKRPIKEQLQATKKNKNDVL